ncbi:MAG: metalloregulator ArsR/SmtB family transcription factor [Pseudomonadota bacterium]
MLKLDEAAAGLEALGNPNRLEIYRLLVRAGDQGKPVGQIQQATGIAASTLSHHLKHLELAGLILRRKQGTTHFCCANYPAMDGLISYLTEECCADTSPHPGRPH